MSARSAASRLHQLIGKRATGYANWRRGRSRSHDMTVLETLVADLKQQGAAHVACTGDLCNIGLPSEWRPRAPSWRHWVRPRR